MLNAEIKIENYLNVYRYATLYTNIARRYRIWIPEREKMSLTSHINVLI